VNLITDLSDALLLFARTRESMTPAYANVSETIQRSVQAVRLHPRHHARSIDVHCGPQVSGWFDQRKLERALYNLLLNACEAAPPIEGKVEVTAGEASGAITLAVADNGPGIAESIRQKLFHPFVSYGKENGTGLGLAVVQKIVQDHGGEIVVERTTEDKTVFRMVLRGRAQEAMRIAGDFSAEVSPAVSAQRENAASHWFLHPVRKNRFEEIPAR
jgi:signal transduction histidine kinase